MRIEPSDITQVIRARHGRMVRLDDDVQSVARDLRDIDANLHLDYSEEGETFIVTHEPEPGEEYLVLATPNLDQRIVHEIRFIMSPGYDYVDELDKLEDAAHRARDHEFAEKVGERAEHLAHALRRDLGLKRGIIVPREV